MLQPQTQGEKTHAGGGPFKQLPTHKNDQPGVVVVSPSSDKERKGFLFKEELQELTGEALVMCIKGLANLNYKLNKAQRLRLTDLLLPYVLNEKVRR